MDHSTPAEHTLQDCNASPTCPPPPPRRPRSSRPTWMCCSRAVARWTSPLCARSQRTGSPTQCGSTSSRCQQWTHSGAPLPGWGRARRQKRPTGGCGVARTPPVAACAAAGVIKCPPPRPLGRPPRAAPQGHSRLGVPQRRAVAAVVRRRGARDGQGRGLAGAEVAAGAGGRAASSGATWPTGVGRVLRRRWCRLGSGPPERVAERAAAPRPYQNKP